MCVSVAGCDYPHHVAVYFIINISLFLFLLFIILMFFFLFFSLLVCEALVRAGADPNVLTGESKTSALHCLVRALPHTKEIERVMVLLIQRV